LGSQTSPPAPEATTPATLTWKVVSFVGACHNKLETNGFIIRNGSVKTEPETLGFREKFPAQHRADGYIVYYNLGVPKIKRHLVIIISTILFITLISGIVLGCTASSPILGEWEYMRTGDTIEFTRNGDVILNSGPLVTTGKYHLVGSDVVKFQTEGWGALWIDAMGGSDSWQYTISGSRLTVTFLGQPTIFIRK